MREGKILVLSLHNTSKICFLLLDSRNNKCNCPVISTTRKPVTAQTPKTSSTSKTVQNNSRQAVVSAVESSNTSDTSNHFTSSLLYDSYLDQFFDICINIFRKGNNYSDRKSEIFSKDEDNTQR